MKRVFLWSGLCGLALACMALVMPVGAAAADAPRISPEVLKALIGNPEVTVIDVRRGKDYDGSTVKVAGAVRESEKSLSWADKYGKDKMLVLYCA